MLEKGACSNATLLASVLSQFPPYLEITPLYLAPISLVFLRLADRLRSYESVT